MCEVGKCLVGERQSVYGDAPHLRVFSSAGSWWQGSSLKVLGRGTSMR